MGMTIITDGKDSFTVTKERFYSQRLTREKIYVYFKYLNREKISFTLLDTYNYVIQGGNPINLRLIKAAVIHLFGTLNFYNLGSHLTQHIGAERTGQ